MKTRQTYIETYAKPYPYSTKPELGSNGLISDGCNTHLIEIRSRGKVEVDGVPMEFMDLRVYVDLPK